MSNHTVPHIEYSLGILILKVINNTAYCINAGEVEKFGENVWQDWKNLTKNFPMTLGAHKIFCHTAQLQRLYSKIPIGRLSEEPFESMNRRLRHNIDHHSMNSTRKSTLKPHSLDQQQRAILT